MSLFFRPDFVLLMIPGRSSRSAAMEGRDEQAVTNFKGFLRIESITHQGPKGSYHEAIAFLKKLLGDEIGLTITEREYVAGKPVLIATWAGEEPSLPSLLLNSHYDVVPAVQSEWEVGAFDAVEKENGDIYARGTQDMKCVCIQYVEAIRRLKAANKNFKRTVHLSFVPDEEIGGLDGMGKLVNDKELFNSLNIGMALDEGLANETNRFTVFNGERGIWWLKVKSEGPTGHGSRFIKDTAMQKLINSINRFLAFRAEQEARLGDHGCQHAVAKKEKLGDVVTVNLTVLKGGVTSDGGKTYAVNVIPTEAEAAFDIRIPPSVPFEEFEAKVKEWTKEDGLSYSYYYKEEKHAVSSIDPVKSPWWDVFSTCLADMKLDIETEIFPAGTDSRFLRKLDIPAFGFSPINNTKILLHDHNERLNRSVFLRGIEIYETLITTLANAAPLAHEK